jgi:soluble lytic murein transglycosylase
MLWRYLNLAALFNTLFVSLLMITPLAQGATDVDITEQRRLFSRAEQIAHKPKSWEYKHIMQELKDYPLRPYAEQKTLMRFPYLSNKDKIERFLIQYENTPLDRPLRKKWLQYLHRQNQGQLFVHFYKDIGSTELYCNKLTYELSQGVSETAILDQVDDLWLVGKSQPKQCNSLFKLWKDKGRRTPDMIWQRLALAADGGNHTLIPYLSKLLPKEQQYLGDLWLKVRRSPSYVSRVSLFPGADLAKETQILTYGLRRLAWRDRELALKSWERLNKRFTFSQEQVHSIASRFAISLASSNHKQAGEWLDKANTFEPDEALFRWHLTHLLREQDWHQVLSMVDAAPESIKQENAYQYWQARSYEQVDANELANSRFNLLASQRHYYGFLASGKTNQPVDLAEKPLIFSQSDLDEIAANPAMLRAKEFLALKRYTSARREWNYIQSVFTHDQRLMSAVIADQWGWHDRAIFTLAQIGYLDDVTRRFPLAFGAKMREEAKRQNIDPAWAFAIARRESSFMADANSSAGAKGLMQLLPSTVKHMTKQPIKTRTLYEPNKNIEYGTQYLRYLMDRMEENSVLATASYNAGWARVRRWIPKDQSVPLDVWIETIPYKETREYVKAVLAYRQIYHHKLGENQNLFNQFADMQIGSP